MVKKILQFELQIIARLIIRRYRPRVVAVTGSVGKTTTKDAITLMLKSNGINARAASGNYNNEIGVPLTIIGTASGRSSWLRWLGVILKGWWVVLAPTRYPDFLVLEMAADHPGDIAYLARLAQPDIAVITAIQPVHTEFFRNLDGVKREKGSILQYLKKDGTAILNADDSNVLAFKDVYHKSFLTYGAAKAADVRADKIALVYDQDPHLKAHITAHSQHSAMILPHFVAEHQLSNVLAAVAVGVALKIPLGEILHSFKDLRPPQGRMNVMPGIKHTVLIDDSYNSSPASAISAVKSLKQLAGRKKTTAVLGDMLELGADTESAHQLVGRAVAQNKISELIAVGELATDIGAAAIEAGMSKSKVFSFDTAEAAGRFLQDRMQKGNVILIKGSQGVRMEKVTKEVMAEPLKAQALLVRQGPEWQK